jgi:hypothetical protein
MTDKTLNHHPEVLALKAKFTENKFAIADVDTNIVIFPSRKALADHGLPEDEFLTVLLQYVPESNGWIIVFQAKIRKIDGSDPKFGEEPTKMLLEAVCELMKKEIPSIDEEGTLPLTWEVNMDVDAITNEGYRMGVTQCSIMIKIDLENLFGLLKSFESFPEVAFQDYAELSPEEQEEVMKKTNLLPLHSEEAVKVDIIDTKS